MADASIYFATNRKPNDPDNPTDFTDEIVGDVDSLRFGRADFTNVNLVPDGDIDALGATANIFVAPEQMDPTDATKSTVGSKLIFENARDDMVGKQQDALFYVHGYNYTFRESVARAAQLQSWFGEGDDGIPLLVFLFAWPSNGKGLSPATYKDDRTRAQASGPAIARGILKAVDHARAIAKAERCNQRIHILAHSMGNWALRGAVQNMRTFVGNNIPPLFDQVTLLAADEDDDTLSLDYKMRPLLRGCRRVSVYSNRYDVALKGSHTVMGNPDRLGTAGPARQQDLDSKVVSVSVASVVDERTDPEQHQYYRINPIVRRDLVSVLQGRADNEIPGRSLQGTDWVLTGGA